MVDAAAGREPSRFRRTMTRAVWPIALAVPGAPVIVAVLLRPPGSDSAADSFLFTLLVICAVLLLGTLASARLLEFQWTRTGRRELTAQQAIAELVLGLGALWFTVGVAALEGPTLGLVGQATVHGLFAVLIATGALVVFALRRIREQEGEEKRLQEGDEA